MSLHCSSCGATNPDYAEFCMRCGTYFSPEEREAARERFENPICYRCGTDLLPGAEFCTNCGAPQGARAQVARTSQAMGILRFARMLALIPGIFDIFGLGHLLLRRWGRGVSFLACSAGVFLARIKLQELDLVQTGWGTAVMIASLAIFLVQMWDVFRITYQMERALQ